MKLHELFTTAGQPFMFYPGMVSKFGISVNAAVFLSFIGWKTFKDQPEAWIALSTTQITEATGLSVDEQAAARKKLIAAELIEEEYKRLDHQLVFRLKNKDLDPPVSRMAIPEIPEWGNGKFPNGTDLMVQEKEKEKKGHPENSLFPDTDSPPEPRVKSDKEYDFDTSELRIRLGALFGRKPETKWPDKEWKAFKEIRKLRVSKTDLEILEKFYAYPQKVTFARKSLSVLLNNFHEELDKARTFKPPPPC